MAAGREVAGRRDEARTGERRRLVKVGEIADLCADHHQIEGTKLDVVELLIAGFQYSSQYYLLRSAATIGRLADAGLRDRFSARPSAFGRRLEFGRDLDRDPDGTVVYLGAVPSDKLIVGVRDASGE